MVPCGDAEALAQADARRQCAAMTHDPNDGDDVAAAIAAAR